MGGFISNIQTQLGTSLIMDIGRVRYTAELPRELAAVPLIIDIFILVNNILVLITFKRMQSLRPHHHFMIGLAMADLMAVIPVAILAGILVNGEIYLTKFICDLMGVVTTITFEVNSLVHSAMSIEKCISVVSPIKHRNFAKSKDVKKVTAAIITCCFLFPLLFNVILKSVGVVDFRFHSAIPQCILTNENGSPSYHLTVVLFVVSPMVIQVITQAIIFNRIKRMRTMTKNKVIKAIKTLSLTLGVSYTCWTPTLVLQVWVVAVVNDPPGWFIFMGVQILMANSGTSGLIYYTNLPNFRKAFTSAVGQHRGRVSDSTLSQRPMRLERHQDKLVTTHPQASEVKGHSTLQP